MGKIIQFKNKPTPLSYGQYYYDNDDNTMESVEDSDSVKKPYNKFSNQTLQTTVVSDEARDLIIDEQSINLIKELNNYSWLEKKSRTPVDKWNHLLDAARYAVTYQLQNPNKGRYYIS